MQLRRWVVAGVATAVVAGAAAAYLWRAQAPAHVRPGTTVSLRDGQITFRAPKGWRREACPHPDSGCVIFRAGQSPIKWNRAERSRGRSRRRHLGGVNTPDPHAPEGDISRLLLDPTWTVGGEVRYFTVDGVPFAQTHMDAITSPFALPATTLVLGVLPNNDDVRIACSERAKPALVKAGCQIVIDSLHVRT
jgi:hypothetical protein